MRVLFSIFKEDKPAVAISKMQVTGEKVIKKLPGDFEDKYQYDIELYEWIKERWYLFKATHIENSSQNERIDGKILCIPQDYQQRRRFDYLTMEEIEQHNERFKKIELIEIEHNHEAAHYKSSHNAILQEFNQQYSYLKADGQWGEIILLGNTALKENLNDVEKAQVHSRLASSFFYSGTLGDYDRAYEQAYLCYELADKHNVADLKVKGLYLLSAVSRVKNNHDLAREYISQAKSIYDAYQLNKPLLKGKIYFNWGSAEGNDPRGDLLQEKQYYLEALMCYKQENALDDIVRIVSRLVLNAVKREDAIFATEMIKNHITPEMINTKQRSAGHYYLALSRLYHLEGDSNLAQFYADKAWNVASDLNACTDLNRPEELLLIWGGPAVICQAYQTVSHSMTPPLLSVLEEVSKGSKKMGH